MQLELSNFNMNLLRLTIYECDLLFHKLSPSGYQEVNFLIKLQLIITEAGIFLYVPHSASVSSSEEIAIF